MARDEEKRHDSESGAADLAPRHGGGGHRRGQHGHDHGGHEGHEGAPEWLISFADNVTLLMGFFVIMLALSMKPTAGSGATGEGAEAAEGSPETLDWVLAVRAAFNNPVSPESEDPREQLLVQRLLDRARGASDASQDGLEGREHDVRSIRPGELYAVGGAVPFDAHSAELSEAGRAAAAELAAQLRGYGTALEVRGHCSAKEARDREDRGMELCYQRALAVARVLVAEGIEWRRIRLTACGPSDAVAPQAYDEDRQRSNQRVEVFQVD